MSSILHRVLDILKAFIMELTHNAASVTVTELHTNKGKEYVNPNNVLFTVKYPDGYSGNKIMPEGPVIISKESAEIFAAQGIGSVTEDADKAEGVTNEKAVDYSKLNKAQLQSELTSKGIAYDESATKAVLLELLANDKNAGVTEDADKAE